MTRSRLPAVRTLPSRTWPTASARAIEATSWPSRCARKAEAREATRIPSTRTSAFMISSAIPSQRYAWSRRGLMSENGSTAIATASGSRASAARCRGSRWPGGGGLGRACSGRRRDVQPRLAQPVDQSLDEIGEIPLRELLGRDTSEVGPERQPVPHLSGGRRALAELTP
ncbi:MAG: hypothetical protein U0599_16825 [Vicinamibacteria bacterium]